MNWMDWAVSVNLLPEAERRVSVTRFTRLLSAVLSNSTTATPTHNLRD